jgi:hypothetical protein
MTTATQRAEADLLDTYKHAWQLGAVITPSVDDRAEMLIALAHRENHQIDSLTDSDWKFIRTVLVTAVCSADLPDLFGALQEAEGAWSDYVECPTVYRSTRAPELSLDGCEERLRTELDLAVWPLLSARQPCPVCVHSLPRLAWKPADAGWACVGHTSARLGDPTDLQP